MSTSRVLIIIPAHNEEANIKRVIEACKSKCPYCDFLVVNDCSQDKTELILDSENVTYISLPINLGIGGAVQAGYRYARKHNYDIAIQVDGDNQHDVSFIHDMIRTIEEEDIDIVIGSRFIRKEGFQTSAPRRMGINFLSFLIFLCTGERVYDVTSGFRAVNRYFIDFYANSYPDDYPEPEAIVAAVMHKGKIKEIPVIMHERDGGKSSITFKRSIYYMIKVSLAIVICRISFGIRRGKRNAEHS